MNPGIPLVPWTWHRLYRGNRKEDALRELSGGGTLRAGRRECALRLARLYRAMGRPEMAKAEF